MGLCATPPSDAVTLTGFASTPVHVASTGTYIVQPGDTMMAIAARHGISVSELAGVSGLRRDSSVYAGERLTIPASQPSTGVTYIVRSGDTLGNIARQFGTTIKNTMSTNQLLSTRIYVGRRLVIPDATLETADNWMGRIVNLPSGSPSMPTASSAPMDTASASGQWMVPWAAGWRNCGGPANSFACGARCAPTPPATVGSTSQ